MGLGGICFGRHLLCGPWGGLSGQEKLVKTPLRTGSLFNWLVVENRFQRKVSDSRAFMGLLPVVVRRGDYLQRNQLAAGE